MSVQNLEHHGSTVLPELGKVRFAEVDDAPFIFKLVNEPMAKTFRIRSPDEIIYLMWVTNRWLELPTFYLLKNSIKCLYVVICGEGLLVNTMLCGPAYVP